MTVDPDPIADRTRTVDRSDLKMKSNDQQSIKDRADIDQELLKEFDL